MPYPVACLSWVPARPTLLAPTATDEFDRARFLIVDWKRMRAHIELLEELLRPCLTQP